MALILVIDDEKIILNIVREILETVGYDVIEATDGVAGVTQFRKERPDLVLTDINMPLKNGVEVISELRSEFPEVKIIVMGSMIAGQSSLMEMLEVDRFIAKPFTMAELITSVKDILEGG